jgi:hypothetical protein
MLPFQFFSQNVHFAVSLFAALVFFAVFWLYFDAWTVKRSPKGLIKCGAFLLLALSFIVDATVIEQSVLGTSILGAVSETAAAILRMVGYVGIIISELLDPLQPKPTQEGLVPAQFTGKITIETPVSQAVAADSALIDTKSNGAKASSVVGFGSLTHAANLLLPLGTFAIAALYWRRATTGLERHLKPIAVAFAFLTGFEILSLSGLWRTTSNPIIAKLTASFGPLWIAEQVFLLIGAVLLGTWVWRYLTQRFFSQLFMTFITLTLVIFLVTTVSFTFLLVNNVQKQSLSNLKTAANVLRYAIDAKKAETLADAGAVAENPGVIQSVIARDNKTLTSLTSNFLQDKKQSSLIITSSTGQVLMRAEDPSRYGDSLSSDTLIRRALINQSSSSIGTQGGVLAPLVYVKSATPIRDANKKIIGTITVGLVIDNAFVDGIKHSTGLDSAIYASNIRSATTFLAPDGISRLIGVKDTNPAVQKTVLKNGKSFDGSVTVLNRQFLAVYAPLKDVDNTTVGMLFIGVPQSSVLQTAGHSVQLTFMVTVVLLLLAVAPAYLVSKYITKQLN